ncbi:MAG: DUF6488 family protein [Pseudomonadota bacterium]|nr:DUF6488 family protein [Pseudomonadota bacterium]
MKKLFMTLSLCMALFAVQGAYAHGDHVHAEKIDAPTAIVAAKEGLTALSAQDYKVGTQSLDPSWANLDGEIKTQGNGYYIVSFKNSVQGQTLYVLLSDVGELYDMNFTGTFEGLE